MFEVSQLRVFKGSLITVPTSMNRRSLFALAGCGGALLLAGCSTSNMWLDRQYDYSGELKFDSYRQNGDYREATRSQPAQTVPVPVLPAHADERSVAGLYSTIGYIFAFTEYIIESRNTGEAQPYMERYQGLTQGELDRMIGSGNSWFSKVRYHCTIHTPHPQKKEEDVYEWPMEYFIKFGDFEVISGKVRETPASATNSVTRSGPLKARYEDHKWVIDFSEFTANTNASSGV